MYEDRRAWADKNESQVLCILNTLLPHLAILSIATDETDKKYATDIEVKLVGGTIAVRLRKPDCKYRELTLRTSALKSELDKIKEGYAFRYFYGWVDENGVIAEWILVDLDKLRSSGLLAMFRRPILNGDGTHFIPFTIRELDDVGCIIARQLAERKVKLDVSLINGIQRAKQRSYATTRIERPKLTEQERAIINSFPVQGGLWT